MTPTVDSDYAAIDSVATTTVDLKRKSEIDYAASNTLTAESVYPGGRLGVIHKAGNMIPVEIIAEPQAHLRWRTSTDILDAG